ncbi:MAG: translation initiation factor IF-3 [Pseudomonadota bacterium]
MAYEGRFKREERGPRINGQIKDKEVRLIDDEGKMLGVISTYEAMRIAVEKNLDLIEMDPNSKPIVAKLMNYGKFKYETKKKMQEAKKRQIVVTVKEVQFRPNIDKHDFDFKLKHIERFIKEGDKVRICIVFRGREIANMGMANGLLTRIKETVAPYSFIEYDPKLEGRKLILQIAPLKVQK